MPDDLHYHIRDIHDKTPCRSTGVQGLAWQLEIQNKDLTP